MKEYLAIEHEFIKFLPNFFFIRRGDPWDNLKKVKKPMKNKATTGTNSQMLLSSSGFHHKKMDISGCFDHFCTHGFQHAVPLFMQPRMKNGISGERL